MQMDCETFVKILTDELGLRLDAATKAQWRNRQTISPTILRNSF
jgi:hypothetical protein